jgi:hypothetical protein
VDVDRTAALFRSLTTAASRRHALSGLVGGMVGLFGAWTDEATARNCKKLKNRAKRKKCLARTRCLPSCAGKACGPDGCDGACGSCASGLSCVNGICCAPVNSATTCGGRCGTQIDACERAVNCGRCPTGDCVPNPCGLGGDCTATTSGSYVCTCPAGFAFNGVTCATHCGGAVDPCGQHGVCTATGASTYTCACVAGYVSNGVTCLPE